MSDFNKSLIFSIGFRRTQIPNFIEIRPVGAEFFHADIHDAILRTRRTIGLPASRRSNARSKAFERTACHSLCVCCCTRVARSDSSGVTMATGNGVIIDVTLPNRVRVTSPTRDRGSRRKSRRRYGPGYFMLEARPEVTLFLDTRCSERT